MSRYMTPKDFVILGVVLVAIAIGGAAIYVTQKNAEQAELIEALTAQPAEAETNDAPVITWARNVRPDIAIELGFVGRGGSGKVIWRAVTPDPEPKKGWFGRTK